MDYIRDHVSDTAYDTIAVRCEQDTIELYNTSDEILLDLNEFFTEYNKLGKYSTELY